MNFTADWTMEDAGPTFVSIFDSISPTMLLATVITGLAGGALSWAKAKRSSMEKAVRTPPIDGVPLAPGGHWLLGHMPSLEGGGDFRRGQREVVVDPANADGVCSFWFVNKPAVSFLRGADVKAVLGASSYRCGIKILQLHTSKFLGEFALVLLMGREWKHYRSAVHRSFTPSALAKSQAAINELGDTLAASLLSRTLTAAAGGRYVTEVLPLMKMATIDVFGRSALGVDLGCCATLTPSLVAEAFDFLAKEYNRRLASPLNPASTLYWIPTAANRRHARERGRLRSFIAGLIEKGRADLAAGKEAKRSEFLTRLIKAGDANNSDAILTDILMVLLFGGYDTTSITLSYALHLLATHPHVEEMVTEEIRAVMGGPRRQGVGTDGDGPGTDGDGPVPTPLKDHACLPLTRAVVLETLRLYPPAPVTTRTLEKPLEMHGNIIPAGTMMYVAIWSIQRHPENYPAPDEFRPDRWARRDGEGPGWVERHETPGGAAGPEEGLDCGTTYVPPARRDAFCAFSGGARNCVGRVLAMQEATTILACLLRDLRFESVPGYVLQPKKASVVQNPHDGLPMVIRPRNALR